jgi:hypothetical protein
VQGRHMSQRDPTKGTNVWPDLVSKRRAFDKETVTRPLSLERTCVNFDISLLLLNIFLQSTGW